MKYFYLFNEGSRAAEYGIGTYMKQMVECLQIMPHVSINRVQLQSEKSEFSIEDSEICRTYSFPKLSIGSQEDNDLYCRNIWVVLQQYICLRDDDELVFILNYFQEYAFISLIKRTFPASSVFFTVHYMTWCFTIKGNLSYFKRIVASEESLLSDEKEKQIYQQFFKEKRLFEDVDMIICLSTYTKRLLIECYQIAEQKISLVYNGLKDDATLFSFVEKQKQKMRLYFEENEKIILFVGRLDDEKGISVLIQAFRVLIRKYSNCRLLIVGDGNFSIYLKECKDIWAKITFTGRLEKEELFRFYQIADIGVMQSTHEQCSYVAIEMMMHGIPLIVTNSTGLSEMVTRKSGLKVSVLENEKSIYISEIALASKILYLLRNPQYCKSKAINSRKRFETIYSLESMRRKLQNLFNKNHKKNKYNSN